MSDLYGAAISTVVGLSASTTKTALQILSPANHRVRILGWSVFFDGTNSVATPVRVRFLRQTTAGTMSSVTPTKTAPRPDTLLTLGYANATFEPAAGDILDTIYVHPQQGYEVRFTPGQEFTLGGSERVGIDCTAGATVNVIAKILFEE